MHLALHSDAGFAELLAKGRSVLEKFIEIVLREVDPALLVLLDLL